MLSNASYFDQDLDNYVFRVFFLNLKKNWKNYKQKKVPKNVDFTEFFIYMNIDDKVDYAEKLNNEKDEFEIMKDILMLIPEERIDSIYVDADEIIM